MDHLLFQEEVKKLVNLLLKIDDKNLSNELISMLFDMVVGGTFSHQIRHDIVSPDALLLIVHLIRRCPLSLQLETWNRLAKLIEECQRNLELCRSIDLLNESLHSLMNLENDTLFDRLLRLIEMLGRHSFSFKNLQNYFRLIRETLKGEKLIRLEKLLKSLQIIVCKKGPSAVFDFDGSYSCGLLVPAFKLASGGYSVAMWIRIEEYINTSRREPRIFSFLNFENIGIVCSLSKQYITVAYCSGNTFVSQTFREFIFQTGIWYFVTLVHVPKFFGRSEVILYINGKHVSGLYLTYPQISLSMSKNSIGANHTAEEISTTVYTTTTQPSFRGQLAMFCLFSEVLPLDKIQNLYNLGYEEPHQIKKTFEDTLAFLYHPKATSQDISFDLANNLHAIKVGSLKCIVTEHLKDTIHCAGGVKLLFCLFDRLGQISRNQLSSSRLSSSLLSSTVSTKFSSSLSTFSVAHFFSLLLSLVSSFLDNHRNNQLELLHCRGMRVLAKMIKERDWKLVFDETSFAAIDVILLAAGTLDNEKLKKEVLLSLYFDFELWSSTSFTVQKQYLLSLLKNVTNHMAYCRQLFGVQQLLDTLQRYYSYPEDKEENSLLSTDSQLILSQQREALEYFQNASANDRKTLTNNEIGDLRHIVMEIMKFIVFKDIALEEMKAIIYFLHHNNKSLQLIDALNFILWLFQNGTKGAVDSINDLGGINCFFHLGYHSDLRVRNHTIMIVAKFLELLSEKKSKNLLITQMIPWLLDSLSSFPLDKSTYNILKSLLFAIPLDNQSNKFPNIIEIDGSQIIKNPEILSVIFNLVLSSSLDLQQYILQDLMILLSQAKGSLEENNACLVMLSHFGWQDWLLAVLAHIRKEYLKNADVTHRDKEKALVVRDIILSIFNALFYYSFVHRKDGWRIIPETECFLITYKTQLNIVKLNNIFYQTLIASLNPEIRKYLNSTESQVTKTHFLNNLPYLALFLEEYFFVFPQNDEITLDDSGDTIAFRSNSRQLSKYMHRSKKIKRKIKRHYASDLSEDVIGDSKTNNLTPTADASRSASEEEPVEEIGLWKDFELCKCFTEAMEFLMKEPFTDIFWSCDTLSFFGPKSRPIFHTLLRLLLTLLKEGELFYDRDALRTKQKERNEAEMELLGINLPLLKTDQNRSKLLQYIKGLNARDSEEWRHIDQFFERVMERIKLVLDTIVKRNEKYLLSSKALQNNTKIVLYVLRLIFKIFKKSVQLQDTVHLSILPGLKDLIRQFFDNILAKCLDEGQEEINPFLEHRHAFERDAKTEEFLAFFEELQWKFPLSDKLRKAEEDVESEQIENMRATLNRRKEYLENIQRQKSERDQQLIGKIKKMKTESIIIHHKYSYRETQRILEAFRTEQRRQQSTARHWTKISRFLTYPRSIWQTPRCDDTMKQSLFWKLDKSEQPHRLRRKLKVNFEGTSHPEASFTYFKVKWERDQEEKEKLSQETLLSQRPLLTHRNFEQSWKTPFSSQSAPPSQSNSPPSSTRSVTKGPSTLDAVLHFTTAPSPMEVSHRKRSSSTTSKSKENSLPSKGDSSQQGTSAYEAEAEIDDLLLESTAQEFEVVDSSDKSSSDLLGKNATQNQQSLPSLSSTHEESSSLLSSWPSKNRNEILFASTCELIYPEIVVHGIIELTKTKLLFSFNREYYSAEQLRNATQLKTESATSAKHNSSEENTEGFRYWTLKFFSHKIRDRTWKVNAIVEIYSRRYLLNWTALEIFLDNHRNFLINLPNKKSKELYKQLISLKPKNLRQHFYGQGKDLYKKNAKITELWKSRQISNFEYLMYLNMMSGRTYNDLTQYPVFPWILANYESETLDLNDPKNFRDLTKPIGALNPERLKKFQHRFENFDDEAIPPFHYGSHYSSAATVLYYLIRVEPFTSLFICLQGGRFDYPDRLFDSIATAWNNCLTNTSDVRELIPEFFYFPEFLVNINRLDLGIKQNNEKIGDVVLPRWAKDEHDFIRKHREALESEYVSQNLHHWIDLIFGYKQRGVEAIKAHNTFYYLTYEGAIDFNSLEDPTQRQAVLDQIQNFGQTPAQLFTTPHPCRDPPKPVINKDRHLNLFAVSSLGKSPPCVQQQIFQLPFNCPYLLFSFENKLITINTVGEYLIHKWYYKDQSDRVDGDSEQAESSPFKLEIDANFSTSSSLSSFPLLSAASSLEPKQKLALIEKMLLNINSGYENRRIDIFSLLKLPHSSQLPSPLPSVLVLDEVPSIVITYGHWDNSIKVAKFEEFEGSSKTLRTLQTIRCHKQPITCCHSSGSYLVTGSRDATVRVFRTEYRKKEESFFIQEDGHQILYGHHEPIIAVFVRSDLDMVVSTSRGVCLIHNLSKAQLIRAIEPSEDLEFSLINVTFEGTIVLYAHHTKSLFVYSINGKLLAVKSAQTDQENNSRYNVAALAITSDGRHLITAGGHHVTLWRLFDLTILETFPDTTDEICAMTLDKHERVILTALVNGKLSIFWD